MAKDGDAGTQLGEWRGDTLVLVSAAVELNAR